MKKVLALALGMLLIPFTAFGMQTMDEAAMDSITGQSGVAISVNNVGIYSSGETVWYQGGEGDVWFGISGGNEITRITAMTDDVIDGYIEDFSAEAQEGYGTSHPLVIRTMEGTTAFAGAVAGVQIDLGTLEIRNFSDGVATEFGTYEGTDPSDEDFTYEYGRIIEDGGVTAILGGNIAIVPYDAWEATQ